MACRLPGGIDSPEQLWETLLRGDDLVTEIPADRWDADDYYDPEPGVPGRSVSKWGAFLDDVAGFDSEFFGISDREATASDPQHRLLLETSWEAMEHAGLTREALDGLADRRVRGFDTRRLPTARRRRRRRRGAVRLHRQQLQHGVRADRLCPRSPRPCAHSGHRMLVGPDRHAPGVPQPARGRKRPRPRRRRVAGCWIPASGPRVRPRACCLPPDDCHAFDIAADGFVPGEGCAVVLLKRLADAQRDGDRILAVIRGTAANQDGRTVNIATPSRAAQVAAYRAALAAAGVDAGSVGMVEAHGTGTPTGDPIEYASLAEVYGVDGPCALGIFEDQFRAHPVGFRRHRD